MSEEVNKRLFAHYTNLSNGNYKSGNSVQDELVASDAKKHLADLIKKNPSLVEVEEVVEEVEEVKESKSKGKK